jgi:hypothetical protein
MVDFVQIYDEPSKNNEYSGAILMSLLRFLGGPGLEFFFNVPSLYLIQNNKEYSGTVARSLFNMASLPFLHVLMK